MPVTSIATLPLATLTLVAAGCLSTPSRAADLGPPPPYPAYGYTEPWQGGGVVTVDPGPIVVERRTVVAPPPYVERHVVIERPAVIERRIVRRHVIVEEPVVIERPPIVERRTLLVPRPPGIIPYGPPVAAVGPYEPF